MRQSRLGAEDKLVWPLNASRVYSTKSGYFEAVKQQNIEDTLQHQVLNGHQNCLQNFNWIKNIWPVKTAPKYSFTRKIWSNLPTTTTLDLQTDTFDQVLGTSSSVICLPPSGVSVKIFVRGAQPITTQAQRSRITLGDNTVPGTTSLFMDAARRPQDRTAGFGWISYDSRNPDTSEGTRLAPKSISNPTAKKTAKWSGKCIFFAVGLEML
ncbi:hypothetical protein DY000_02020830 [Brassica cretica]|uniref:Uncharacterized protein n=1 Tax=Brassica cretica TaxID=69181 RepID=A0ABQ7EC59_BRACR|nr:hypothetical protein DY000_02020830 [Brassica cretica]